MGFLLFPIGEKVIFESYAYPFRYFLALWNDENLIKVFFCIYKILYSFEPWADAMGRSRFVQQFDLNEQLYRFNGSFSVTIFMVVWILQDLRVTLYRLEKSETFNGTKQYISCNICASEAMSSGWFWPRSTRRGIYNLISSTKNIRKASDSRLKVSQTYTTL